MWYQLHKETFTTHNLGLAALHSGVFLHF